MKQASYSRSKFLEKVEKLLSSSWVDYFNQKKKIPLTQPVITDMAKLIFEDLKEKEGADETFLVIKVWSTLNLEVSAAV